MPKLTKRFIDSLTPDPERDRIEWDSDLSGFGIRVLSTGRKTYVLQYRNDDGRSRRITLGVHGVLTPKQARAEALRKLADVSLGEDPAEKKKTRRSSLTMAELAERYLDEHLIPSGRRARCASFGASSRPRSSPASAAGRWPA